MDDLPTRLTLRVDSVAGMDLERALAVARVIDAHPALRPRRVGGDPPRISVESTFESVVSRHGLPIDWLTFREMKPDLEMGAICFLPGRGSAGGTPVEGGAWEYDLWGNSIVQTWGPSVARDPDLVREVTELFDGLVTALDAAWGAVVVDQRLSMGPAVWKQLPGVYWINYFGPAFTAKQPRLSELPDAQRSAAGGLFVSIASQPLSDVDSSTAAAALRDVFGARAFEFANPNPALPSVEDQLAASPGPDEMPWVAWEQARAERGLQKRHSNARKRLATLINARPAPAMSEDAIEWSTSLDMDEWKLLFRYLKRRVRGELVSSIGAAVLAVITTAPLDEEDAVTLTTTLGVIQLGWFIDDVDTVAVSLVGPAELVRLCNAWLEYS